ncbi:hypothetical protein BCR32DRAFT_229252 [Anaeromyces robustus]|uniref:Succinate dehydrogenase [ubiquinone] cytochrome b small subunit n=1 Tax=Anaeromyces robustus TaxID=1754192 RepID=A0A1Y1XJZ9_9FUNG|nr:hypothetical protein BCR32DRAFT_229252 [Anaeromyces robustus]|eukprot:ORX86081.1 hypothetical protein BCR32DRAFT_229252 [Anaeromyces robustus]
METINSKYSIQYLKKCKSILYFSNISIKNIPKYNRTLNTVSNSVHLNQDKNYLLNNPDSTFITKKKFYYSTLKYNQSILSISKKYDLKSEENSKKNYIQYCHYNNSLLHSIIRKNGLPSNNSINKKSQFHSSPIIKDLDDDMPKFRDSKEKKEYIKLATKRNDIAAKGRMEGSYHWALSKIVIGGILTCVVASGIIGHHMFIDVILGGLLPMHVYYTFQDLIFDYIPYRRYPKVNKFLIWILRGVTIISLYSMFKFNTEDIGISDAAKQAWSSAKTHKPDEDIKDEDIYYDK